MTSEGYIKFRIDHRSAPPPERALVEPLVETRARLHDLGLVGERADGISYGNVSRRDPEGGFVITGSRTGRNRILGPEGFSRVEQCIIDENRVVGSGPVEASSESMSHGAIYAADPRVGCVIHVHSARIFAAMLAGAHPRTSAEAEYGTPAIAREIMALVNRLGEAGGVFVTAGHEEGVFAYGASVAAVEERIMRLYDESGGRT